MTTHTTGFELNPKWDSFCSFILFWHFKIINNFTRGLFEETVIVYITSAVAAGERGRGEREWGALAPLEFFRTEILKITVMCLNTRCFILKLLFSDNFLKNAKMAMTWDAWKFLCVWKFSRHCQECLTFCCHVVWNA